MPLLCYATPSYAFCPFAICDAMVGYVYLTATCDLYVASAALRCVREGRIVVRRVNVRAYQIARRVFHPTHIHVCFGHACRTVDSDGDPACHFGLIVVTS